MEKFNKKKIELIILNQTPILYLFNDYSNAPKCVHFFAAKILSYSGLLRNL